MLLVHPCQMTDHKCGEGSTAGPKAPETKVMGHIQALFCVEKPGNKQQPPTTPQRSEHNALTFCPSISGKRRTTKFVPPSMACECPYSYEYPDVPGASPQHGLRPLAEALPDLQRSSDLFEAPFQTGPPTL